MVQPSDKLVHAIYDIVADASPDFTDVFNPPEEGVGGVTTVQVHRRLRKKLGKSVVIPTQDEVHRILEYMETYEVPRNLDFRVLYDFSRHAWVLDRKSRFDKPSEPLARKE